MKKSYSGFNASALVVLGKRPVNAWSSFSGLHALLIYSSLNFMHLRSLCQQQCFFLIVFLLLGEPVHSMKCAVSKIDDAFLVRYSQCCFFFTSAAATHKSHTGSVTTTTTNTLCIWTFEHIFIAGDNHVFHDVCIHFTLYLPVTSKMPRYLIHVPFFVPNLIFFKKKKIPVQRTVIKFILICIHVPGTVICTLYM